MLPVWLAAMGTYKSVGLTSLFRDVKTIPHSALISPPRLKDTLSSKMHLSSIIAFAGIAAAAPRNVGPRAFSIPTDDGFPNPNPQQLAVIAKQAGGGLSNAGAPTVNQSSIPVFQLVAFNENFEVAFFTSMLQKLNAGRWDSEIKKANQLREEFVEIIKTVVAVRRYPHSAD
jgi:hypothetical protein